MADLEQLTVLKQGVEAWNAWYEAHQEVIPDFNEADLRGMDLRKARLDRAEFFKSNLCRAKLAEANLNLAYLAEANLSGSDLRHAALYRAWLGNADLRKADLRGANLPDADLHEANLLEADLRGADLRGAILTKTDVTDAIFTDCQIYGISVWSLQGIPKQERDLIVSDDDEPTLTVDGLELAQFLYLLKQNTKIRQVIDTITSKVVLILGRFTPERKAVLEALRNKLRTQDCVPILFDFEKPSSRNLTETVSTLAHMARFIIADITDARSIPQELQSIVPHLPSVPVQPIILASQVEYGMFESFLYYDWVLEPYRYKTIDELLEVLSVKVIDPVRAKAREIAERRSVIEGKATR